MYVHIYPEYWADLDAASFRIRGQTYNQDRVKTASAPSLFKLIAIDVFDCPEPTFNIASHPNNRLFIARLFSLSFIIFMLTLLLMFLVGLHFCVRFDFVTPSL
jgi:hypothetical protein